MKFSLVLRKVENRFLSVICEPAPSDLGQLVMSADGLINIMDKYEIEPIPNTLSALANGEMFRRLVLDDILDPEVRRINSSPIKTSGYHNFFLSLNFRE